MKHNFDKIIDRRNTNSYKWDSLSHDDVIPMWVADMDFQVAPEILEALRKRLDHGIFGYTMVPDSYYEAVQSWFLRRHNWQIDRSSIIYTTGVVPAISCALKAMTLPGEKVLVQTPVYNCFFSCIKNSGCEILENPLARQGDSYVIDFDDFEAKCADEKTTVFLLCNPHNPVGRVWTRDELQRMSDICQRHNVRIISDEIHCELIMPDNTYIPFATIASTHKGGNRGEVYLTSPSKAFNIAGLQIANIICDSPTLRRRINRAVNINEVCDVNPFGPIALEAAYNHGEEWLAQLNSHLWDNYQTLRNLFAKNLPHIPVMRLEGTYLVWTDITATGMTSDETTDKLMKQARVLVNSGTMYGTKAGEGYIRINIACPKQQLIAALERIAPVLETDSPS